MQVQTVSSINIPEHSAELMPISAFVFYGTNPDFCTAVTRHSIIDNRLSSPTLLKAEQVCAELLLLTNKSESKLIPPKHLLLNTEEHLVWHTKRQQRNMWFRLSSSPIRFTVNWPPLLWVAAKNGSDLKIMALPNNSRPNGLTRLYHAPLMNISSNGTVCQGTAILPKTISLKNINEVENTIFDSAFTHVNHSNTLLTRNTTTEDQLNYWRKKASDNSNVKVSELRFCDLTDNYLKGIL